MMTVPRHERKVVAGRAASWMRGSGPRMTTERFVADYMIANSEFLRLVIVKRDYPSTATIREGG